MFSPIDTSLTEFVVYLAQTLRPEIYLELGIFKQLTIQQIIPYVKTAIGVDKREIPNPNFIFFSMTTDVFFMKIKQQEITIPALDMVFIDANHNHYQVLKDFNNSFPYVNEQGIILLHDTFPRAPYFTAPTHCGDAYQAAWHLRQQKRDDMEIMTIPCHPGLTLIRKSKKQLNWKVGRSGNER